MKGVVTINITKLKEKLEEFLIDLVLDEKAKKTIYKYHVDINRLIDFMEDEYPTEDLTKEIMIEFKKELVKTGHSKTSINSYIVSANKFVKYVTGDKETKLRVKGIRTQRRTSIENVLHPSDFKKMERITKKKNMLDTHYILRTLGYSGIRVNELKFITVENIKKKYFQVENKGKVRDIILPDDIRSELRRYCKDMKIENGYVFPSTKKGHEGKPLNNATVWRKIQKAGVVSKGIKKDVCHPHSIRHMFAKKWLIDNDNDYIALADIMGHEDFKTTAIYTQSSIKEKRQQINNFKY